MEESFYVGCMQYAMKHDSKHLPDAVGYCKNQASKFIEDCKKAVVKK